MCFATPSPRSGQRVGAARRPRVAARARMRKSPVSPGKSLDASAVFSPPVRGRFYQPPGALSIRHRSRRAPPLMGRSPPVLDDDQTAGAPASPAILSDWCAERHVSRASKAPPLGGAWYFRGQVLHMLQRPIIPLRQAASPAPLPPNGKRFHVWTIGCQMNEADSAKIAATLA